MLKHRCFSASLYDMSLGTSMKSDGTGTERNGSCSALSNYDDISAFDENIDTKKKNTETLSEDGKKVGKDVKA
jgi:hypothetical protein